MAYECRILADSVSAAEFRLTTFLCTFPRIILSEANTHRTMSRNSASSRAIPVSKRIRMIESDPFVPVAFGKNQPGMQAHSHLEEQEAREAEAWWRRSCHDAIINAAHLERLGVHKQLANRVLEPYAWHQVIFTGTEWANWDALRDSKHAQPEIRTIAVMMKELRAKSEPVLLHDGQWHLPLVRGVCGIIENSEEFDLRVNGFDPVKVCVGRCARVSYLTHEGTRDPAKDIELHDTLIGNGHMSPFEHACRPMSVGELEIFGRPEYRWLAGSPKPNGGAWERGVRRRYFLGNVEGWVQYRKQIPGEEVYEERT